MINAVIVDDEKKGRDLLINVIDKYCPNVEIVGQAENIKDAFAVIEKEHPDLVFLDIEMPNGNGFDLLKKFDKIFFEIIFTTAYDHYAIKAIKYSALDYLLKPIDIDDLQEAVEKVISRKKKPQQTEQSIQLLLNAITDNRAIQKIVIPDHEGVTMVKVGDIVKCQSDSNYTTIYMANGTKLTSTKTLKDYAQMFEGMPFLRVHNSYLINLDHIKRYVKGDGGYVVMSDDTIVEVSRRRKTELISLLANEH